MENIPGIDKMTVDQLMRDIDKGGKFVHYEYTMSLFIVTFKRTSDISYVCSDESNLMPCLKYALFSIFLGWWGIPWGPIYTIGSLFSCLRGGVNDTEIFLPSLEALKDKSVSVERALEAA